MKEPGRDGDGVAHSADGRRGWPIHTLAAVADLAIRIGTPAFRGAIGQQCTGVIAAGRDGDRVGEAADEDWNCRICSAAVAELTRQAAAPTTHGAILVDLAGVPASNGKPHRWIVETGVRPEAGARRGITGCRAQQHHPRSRHYDDDPESVHDCFPASLTG